MTPYVRNGFAKVPDHQALAARHHESLKDWEMRLRKDKCGMSPRYASGHSRAQSDALTADDWQPVESEPENPGERVVLNPSASDR
jgi:hypothetical protein